MEARKWEDLNSDCMVNVFGRLNLETRLLDIPLVCKQWHQALLNPLYWQKLVFPVKIFGSKLADHALECGESFYPSRLIKFVVDRSNGCATTLVLPQHTTKEDLIYVSDVCPFLETLSLPYTLLDDYGDNVSELIVKWKSLEVVKLGSCSYLVQIIDICPGVSRNIDLVYGGGSIGLMGLISQAVHDGGRHVIGVIPKTLMPREGQLVGTRSSNLMRHLNKGFLAAVCQLPVPGYMFGEAIVCSDAASAEAAKYGFTVVDRSEGVLVLAVASLGEKVVEVTTPMFMLPATLASSMFSAICRLVLHFLQRKNRRVSPTKTHVFSTKTREVL